MWVAFRSDHTQTRVGFSAVYHSGNQRRIEISVRTLYIHEQSRGNCFDFPWRLHEAGDFPWGQSESVIFHSARKNAVTSLNPERDQHRIPPYTKTAVALIKLMRIKEMIGNLRNFDCQTYFLVSTKGNVEVR